MQNVLVAIPTYNEAKNVEKMIRALHAERAAIAKIGFDLHITIADDMSPDGTQDIVKALQAEIPKLEVIKGKKQGLGAAYSRVFDHAIESDLYDVLVMMDCDFSHSPREVKKLLVQIKNGASFVIGSRYVRGGSIPGDWPFIRILNTRVAGFVARYIGGLDSRVKDVTAGFRAMRIDRMNKLRYRSNNASGYSFQINLTNEFLSSGEPIVEVPIKFVDRAAGESKIRAKDIINFIHVAARLNEDSAGKQVIRYLAVGVSGAFVNLGALWLLRTLGIQNTLAIVLSIELSICNNYIGHTLFTFKTTRKYGAHQLPRHVMRLPAFHGAILVSAFTIFAVSISLHNLGFHYLIAQAIGIGLAASLNYLIATRYIWSQFIDPSVRKLGA